MSQPMNREQRRMLKKQGQEVTEEGQVISTKKADSGGSGSGSGGRVTEKGGVGSESKNRRREVVEVQERTSPVQFGKEVRSELKKVSWPGRPEVVNYSLVVLFTVIVLTIFIGVLDLIFSSTVLELFRPR